MVLSIEDIYVEEYPIAGGVDEPPTSENKEQCIKTEEFRKDSRYYTVLLAFIIVTFLVLFFFLFDALNIFKPAVFGSNLNEDGTPNISYKYKDLGLEVAGWALLVGASTGVGFMTGREMIFGKSELYESYFTKCAGNSYLALIIVVLIMVILIVYFFDPWNIWHEYLYNVDENDSCDTRLLDKHKSNMEVGGWLVLAVGTFLLGLGVAYLNYFGRIQTHTSNI